MTARLQTTRRARRGMTLVEVIVALAILLIMSALIFESLQNSITFHNILGARDETVRTARAAISKITRDLQLAYLTPNRTALGSYQTVFVGYDDDPAKLYFATLNHQRLYLDSRECDQAEVTVWAEQAPKEHGNGYILYHRESPRIDQYPDEQGVIWPLAYNVRTFSLRYLDQVSGEWRTTWDTRSGDTPYRLPRAVEIGLVLIAPDPEDEAGERTIDVPFLSTVVLEYAERMPNPSAMPIAGTTSGSSTGSVPGLIGGGNGGYGGGGFAGLSGGALGGTLGALPGAKPAKGAGRTPGAARPPGGPGTPGGLGGRPR
ncbi:MAG: type II secretion system protein GspJ [Myxococcota bacterium]